MCPPNETAAWEGTTAAERIYRNERTDNNIRPASNNYSKIAELSPQHANFLQGGYYPTDLLPERANLRHGASANGMFRGKIHPKLTGDRNQCPTCSELFNSTTAFDKHRTGAYEPDERRCLSVAEMQARGFTRPDGYWRSPASKQQAERLARLRQS